MLCASLKRITSIYYIPNDHLVAMKYGLPFDYFIDTANSFDGTILKLSTNVFD